jgi:predicted nucleic acid-binding protein
MVRHLNRARDSAGVLRAYGSTLLSGNLRDFRQVPGLIVEDWTR